MFRLLRKDNLLPQLHAGERPVRTHNGRVIAPGSNQRWSSDAPEIRCLNGKVVRVAFAFDTHDRKVLTFVALPGGTRRAGSAVK